MRANDPIATFFNSIDPHWWRLLPPGLSVVSHHGSQLFELALREVAYVVVAEVPSQLAICGDVAQQVLDEQSRKAKVGLQLSQTFKERAAGNQSFLDHTPIFFRCSR